MALSARALTLLSTNPDSSCKVISPSALASASSLCRLAPSCPARLYASASLCSTALPGGERVDSVGSTGSTCSGGVTAAVEEVEAETSAAEETPGGDRVADGEVAPAWLPKIGGGRAGRSSSDTL